MCAPYKRLLSPVLSVSTEEWCYKLARLFRALLTSHRQRSSLGNDMWKESMTSSNSSVSRSNVMKSSESDLQLSQMWRHLPGTSHITWLMDWQLWSCLSLRGLTDWHTCQTAKMTSRWQVTSSVASRDPQLHPGNIRTQLSGSAASVLRQVSQDPVTSRDTLLHVWLALTWRHVAQQPRTVQKWLTSPAAQPSKATPRGGALA